MRHDAIRVSPKLTQNLLQEPELINLEDYEDDFEEPECVELGDLRSPALSKETECIETGQLKASHTTDTMCSKGISKSPPLSNETEFIETGQLKASPTTDTMCSKGISNLLTGLDQSRQEMPSLADAALNQRDERDSFEPVWSWEQHQSAWYGCIVDIAGEAAEFLTEGFIGDGNAIHATEMREDIEASKSKKKQKDTSKEPTAEQAGAQNEKQQEGQVDQSTQETASEFKEASKEETSYWEFPIVEIEVLEIIETDMGY
jgi:hypothetical protein